MASLESLSNSLERLNVLQTLASARQSSPGDLLWDAGTQYYLNDIAVSPTDFGAYCFTGGASARTTIRGGTDPAATPLLWTPLSKQGVGFNDVEEFTSVAPIVGAAGAFTLPAGASLAGAAAGEAWLVTIQGVIQTPLVQVAATDKVQFTLTGAGAGGTVQALDIQPNVGVVANDFSATAVINVGTGGTAIALQGAYNVAGQVPTLNTGLRVTYVRLY